MNLAILTGGIASGKSTVCKILENFGCQIIDTDRIAHDVVQKDSIVWQQIIETFGSNILKQDKELDRTKLGNIIFSDPLERKKLNRIVHPQVFKQISRTINEMYKTNFPQTVVVDVPLFFELVDKPNPDVILVYLPQELQVKRLMKRNKYSKEEAMKRINSQISMSKKRKLTSSVIDNSGPLRRTKRLTLLMLTNIKLKNKFTKQEFDILLDTLM